MSAADVELLRQAWDAYAQGDVDALAAVLDPDVKWYGAGADPDGEWGCHNRQEALAFMRRARDDGVSVEVLDLHDAGDRVVAVLQRARTPEDDEAPEPHGQVVTVRDGLVTEMVVHPTVESALTAAGL